MTTESKGMTLYSLFDKAWESGFRYAAFLTDYCFSQRQETPYLAYIPDLISKIQDPSNDKYWELAYATNKYELNIELAVGVEVRNPTENIIFFYGGEHAPQLKNFENFLERWQNAVTHYFEHDQKPKKSRQIGFTAVYDTP